MIAPLALAIGATAPALPAAADLEVSATFARTAVAERLPRAPESSSPLHYREAWRMSGRRRPRALTAPLRPVAERGTLILAPRIQSTTSSQCKRPIASPATRLAARRAVMLGIGASVSNLAVSTPLSGSHSRIVLSSAEAEASRLSGSTHSAGAAKDPAVSYGIMRLNVRLIRGSTGEAVFGT